jgi:hypothetical protein
MTDRETLEILLRMFDMARGHLMALWTMYVAVLGLLTGSTLVNRFQEIASKSFAIPLGITLVFLVFVIGHILSLRETILVYDASVNTIIKIAPESIKSVFGHIQIGWFNKILTIHLSVDTALMVFYWWYIRHKRKETLQKAAGHEPPTLRESKAE